MSSKHETHQMLDNRLLEDDPKNMQKANWNLIRLRNLFACRVRYSHEAIVSITPFSSPGQRAVEE